MRVIRVLPIITFWIFSSSIATGSQWLRVIGGTESETFHAIRQTRDGGYIAAGETASFGGGRSDAWVLRTAQDGTVLWQKTYGGSGHDAARAIEQTSSGGYIVAGETDSSGKGGQDALILNIDHSGKVLWQKTYGDFGNEHAGCIQETADGGFIIAGGTASDSAGGLDAWVLKLDQGGKVLWQQAYGSSGNEMANSVGQTGDGGYIVAGYTDSSGTGVGDAWVLKLDQRGKVLWQNTYGGSGNDFAYSIEPTTDGGYIVAGETEPRGGSGSDAWVLRLDRKGGVLWQRAYADSIARSIQQTSDGGYAVAGQWGGLHAGVLKLDGSGNLLWQRTYGSPMYVASSFQQTSDSGYIVAGSTGQMSNNDCFLLKIGEDGASPGCAAAGTSSIVATSPGFREQSSALMALPTNITPLPAKIAGVNSTATEQTLCLQSGPRISVSPATHRFCAMSLGSRQKERLTIANRGSVDLEVRKWERSGEGSDIFVVSAGEKNPCPDYPFTMGPGKSCTVVAMFTPTTIGPRSALLTIESDDPQRSVLYIPLEATAMAEKPDLTLSVSAEAPISCAGESITASSIVSNIPVSAPNDLSFPSAPTIVKFYLSDNGALDPSDTFLGERTVPCLEGDSTDRAFNTLTLPEEAGSGTFYLLGVLDPDNSIRETKENNNLFAVPISCP